MGEWLTTPSSMESGREGLKMIERLIIKNFRSIKEIDIKLGQVNAFIGPNNAGKSNIMHALNLILGEYWPSARSFERKDFHNYESNAIEIEVRFTRHLNADLRVWGFHLEYDGNNFSYLPINDKGEFIFWEDTRGRQRELHVSNEMRNEVFLMYLGLDRQAYQQIKPTQSTIYGKLIKQIETTIDDKNKKQFGLDVRSTYDANIAPYLETVINSTKEFVKKQTGLDLNLQLSPVDPLETLKNLRPYFQEPGATLAFDVEDVGAGIQSALVIAIARAYAQIVRQPLALAIEEPELFLHPHACRHFYNLLLESASDGVQIFYTTHERSFVDLMNYQNIHLVRKISGETRVTSGRSFPLTLNETTKIASKFDPTLNEIFFANHVVLTEGFTDKIAARCALEKLGVNLDKENISIADCGSKDSIPDIVITLKNFQIPCYVLIDEDPGNTQTKTLIERLRSLLGSQNVFLQTPHLEGLFGLRGKLDKKGALEFFPQWFQNNDPPRLYLDLKRQMGY